MKCLVYLYICKEIKLCLFICLFINWIDHVCLFIYLYIEYIKFVYLLICKLDRSKGKVQQTRKHPKTDCGRPMCLSLTMTHVCSGALGKQHQTRDDLCWEPGLGIVLVTVVPDWHAMIMEIMNTESLGLPVLLQVTKAPRCAKIRWQIPAYSQMFITITG